MLRVLHKQNGQAIAIVAIAVATLIGFSGLVINYATLAVNKTQLQAAADAGALAGAQNLVPGPKYSQADAQTNAVAYAKKSPGKSTDTVPTPVITPINSLSAEIQVTVHRSVSTLVGVYDVQASATARVSPAGGIPDAPPFVVARKSILADTNGDGVPDAIDYYHDYTMRMYDSTNPHGDHEFDYCNTVFHRDTSSSDYLNLVENGWDQIATTKTQLYYYGPSTGSESAVNRFWNRTQSDKNTDPAKAQVGDDRLMIIPVIEELPDRKTSENSTKGLEIKGFVGFWLRQVDKNRFGTTYRAYGQFVKVNVPGAVEGDPGIYMGLSSIALVK